MSRIRSVGKLEENLRGRSMPEFPRRTATPTPTWRNSATALSITRRVGIGANKARKFQSWLADYADRESHRARPGDYRTGDDYRLRMRDSFTVTNEHVRENFNENFLTRARSTKENCRTVARATELINDKIKRRAASRCYSYRELPSPGGTLLVRSYL